MSFYRKHNRGLALLLLLSLVLTGCGKSEAPAVIQDISPGAAVSAAPADLSSAEGEAASAAEEKELPAPATLRVSELMVKNRAVLRDDDGDFSDWIEIENYGDSDVELDGCSLSEKVNRAGLPLEGTLKAGERRVYWASGKDRPADGHADFSLSEGESVNLVDAYGRVLSAAPCLTDEADLAVALGEDGEYAVTALPTPGHPNTRAGYDAWQESLTNDSPLLITEVVVHNSGAVAGWRLSTSDWVELKNVSEEAVELSDYYLSDDRNDLKLWRFPEKKLMPGAIYLVRCDELGNAGRPDPSCGFKLDATEEQLYLTKADGTLADWVSLRGIPYGGSYGRMEGANGWFYFAKPDPAANNKDGCRRVSAAPTTLVPDGVYNDVKSVTVELAAEGDIYYVVGDETPTEESERYAEPITLEKTSVVRAIAVEEGALPSRQTTFSYIINENHTLPVLSLVADSKKEFVWMYGAGNKYKELPATLSLYEADGGFTIRCGVKMHGETSLVLEKKNMSVRFRGYYGDEALEYDVYDGGVSRFRSLVLRAGQDYYSTLTKNAACQNLCLQAGNRAVTGRSKFCVLYVNGAYLGIYNLMEKTNEQLYADVLGVSRESVEVIESMAPGTSSIYMDVFTYCMNHDLSVQENYEYVESLVDIDSVIDWIALEGYTANTDLTYGNVRYARSSEGDGKWRLVFYDLDATFWDRTVAYTNMFDGMALYSRQVGKCLIRPLLANAAFKDRMLRRFAELFDTVLSPENVMAELDRLTAIIEPEIERDYKSHGMQLKSWENNVATLRGKFEDGGWNKSCINNICSMLQLTEEERAEYFGE